MIVFHMIAPDCAFHYNAEDAIRNHGCEVVPLP
jgi:hypothetical protein